MARWRLPLLSLALAACGLNAVGVAIDDVANPDASVLPDGSLPDAPLESSNGNGDGQVDPTEGGGEETGTDADTPDGVVPTDATTTPDADDAGTSADADASAIADAGRDADATTPVDSGADTGTTIPPGTIQTLDTSATAVRSIALRNDGVFVAHPGAAERIPLPSGSPQTVSQIQNAVSLVAFNQDIVWISSNAFGRYQSAGTSNSNPGPNNGRDVFVANNRYITSFGSACSSWDYPNFGSKSDHAPNASVQPVAVTGDGTHLFWADAKDNVIYRSTYGGNGSSFTPAKDPTSVIVDGPNLYFTTDTAILRSPKASASSQAIAQNLQAPVSLVTDDTYLYWLERTNGSLKRTPKNTLLGTVDTLATSAAFPAGETYGRLVAVDSEWVYWGNPSDRTIKRYKK